MSGTKLMHSAEREPEDDSDHRELEPEPDRRADPDRMKVLLDLWSKTVDVQLQLTRVAARARLLGLALIASALTIGILLVAIGHDWALTVPLGQSHLTLHSAVLVLAASVGALLLLRMLDLNVYDRMLRGAASFGEDLEEQHLKPELIDGVARGMTQAIAYYAQYADAGTRRTGRRLVYFGSQEDAVADRVRRFYVYGMALPAATAFAMLIATNLGGSEAATPVEPAAEAKVVEPADPASLAAAVPLPTAPLPTVPAVLPPPVVTPAVAPTTARPARTAAGTRAPAAVSATGKPAEASPAAPASATTPAAKPEEPAAKTAEATAPAPATAPPAAKAAESPAPPPEPAPAAAPAPKPAEPTAAAAAPPPS